MRAPAFSFVFAMFRASERPCFLSSASHSHSCSIHCFCRGEIFNILASLGYLLSAVLAFMSGLYDEDDDNNRYFQLCRLLLLNTVVCAIACWLFAFQFCAF